MWFCKETVSNLLDFSSTTVKVRSHVTPEWIAFKLLTQISPAAVSWQHYIINVFSLPLWLVYRTRMAISFKSSHRWLVPLESAHLLAPRESRPLFPLRSNGSPKWKTCGGICHLLTLGRKSETGQGDGSSGTLIQDDECGQIHICP